MSTTYGYSTTAPEATKRIQYNPATKDYDCYVAIDGGDEQCIGSANTYHEAETKCSTYAYDYYSDNHTPEKAVQIALAGVPATDVPALTDLPDQPIGTLADGTTIYGLYNGAARWGVASAKPGNWHLTAGSDGYLGISHNNLEFYIESLSRDSIAALQALFTSGMLEHLLVAAERWESGALLPPTPAALLVQDAADSSCGGL